MLSFGTNRIVALLFFFLPFLHLSAQEGQELFQKGYEAQRNGSYGKALKLYDRAIEANDSIKEAFYNRASIRIAQERYELAKLDLDRTLELDPDYTPAYYNRANIHMENGYLEKAGSDLDEVLEREKEHQKALLLRGQVRHHLGQREKGCQDLRRAQKLGTEKAGHYIQKLCDRMNPLDLESRWPGNEGWKIGNRKEDRHMKKIELLPEGQSMMDWKQLGTVMALKNVQGIPMDTARYFLVKQARGKCKDLQAKTLKKMEREDERYIFFTIRCQEHINTGDPETQFWYVEQGDRHLYAHLLAVRKPRMSKQERKTWMNFFRDPE